MVTPAEMLFPIMAPQAIKCLEGRLAIEMRFQGCESEGPYSLLTCHEGSQCRIHLRGPLSSDVLQLLHLNGEPIRTWGHPDTRIHRNRRIGPFPLQIVSLRAFSRQCQREPK
jgi:hypothetical protein